MHKKLFLKTNVKFEPLSWNWYSWIQLIYPVTAALNLINRYCNILEDFTIASEIHMEAVKNPKLIGGPFVNLDSSYVEQASLLLNKIKEENQNLIQLHQSLSQLHDMIKKDANGDSLESLYAKVPKNLKGLVELVYDEKSRCTVRYIEPLFYKNFYNPLSQSILLSTITNDKRNFILSTPRFKAAGDLELNVPFDSQVLDSIFSSRQKGGNIEEIIELLGLSNNQIFTLKTFFTDIPPSIKTNKDDTQRINIKYFGHACILLQYAGISILIDPIISYQYENTILDRFTYQDLPEEIDYVLITHSHQDHVCLETLLQLRWKIKNIIVPRNNLGFLLDPSLKLALKQLGFKNVFEISEMDSISLSFGEIAAIPFLGEHGDFNIQSKLAYLISINNKKFLFAVDSNNLENELYRNISSIYGSIDILFLGMECEGAPQSWVYGPLIFEPLNYNYDNNRRLSGSDFHKAWNIIRLLSPNEVYVYAMGQEPWLSHIMGLNYTQDSKQIVESDKLIQECHKNNILAERLFCKKEWLV